MVTNNSQVLENLSQEYEHQDKPNINLDLKPLWTNDIKETPVVTKKNGKIEPFVLPFLP